MRVTRQCGIQLGFATVQVGCVYFSHRFTNKRTSLGNNNTEISIMLSPKTLALAFALAPSLISAALFPSDSLVKVIDAKGFKKAMKANVGFVGFLGLEDRY